MIINNLDNSKLKILVDEIDLKNLKIKPFGLISNTQEVIYKLFEAINIQNSNIKDFSIFTYNYKVFLIYINFE